MDNIYLFEFVDQDGNERHHTVNAQTIDSAKKYAVDFCKRFGFTFFSIVELGE